MDLSYSRREVSMKGRFLKSRRVLRVKFRLQHLNSLFLFAILKFVI